MSKWWKKSLSLLVCLPFIGSCTTPFLPSESSPSAAEIVNISHPVDVQTAFGDVFQVFDAPNLSLVERRARAAAVKVRSLIQDGHGSGTYMIAHGRRVVVTAAHVVRSERTIAIDGRDGETVIGKVVFVDKENDLAFIVVPRLQTRTAVRYQPRRSYDERLIGTHITYTGFPSHHDLLTIRGYVASLEHEMVVTNMFGWFGSSGSGVFDRSGRFVGIVSGIDMGYIGVFGMRVPLESIVWVAPVSFIDHEMLKVRIITGQLPGTINTFPGAAAPRRGGLRD